MWKSTIFAISKNTEIDMEKFELTILGCGSATPTLKHMPTSQVLNVREKLFMIDCGEGTQLQFQRAGLRYNHLSHIFISHLHGDHCLGLPGLISTLALKGRTSDIHIFAPIGAEALFRPLFDFFCNNIPFTIHIHEIDTSKVVEIYADRSLKVTSFPLLHRMPTCGFLFQEVGVLPHIRRDMIDFLEIPVCYIQSIKLGAGWTTTEGRNYAHEELTSPSHPPRSYAYCSDTRPLASNSELLNGVDLMFHEATFAESEAGRAKETFHSTARQAATIAKVSEVKTLLIGHFSARYSDENLLLAQAKEVFPETILAKEMMKIPILPHSLTQKESIAPKF